MGGYGGSSKRSSKKAYYDTGGHKVTDKNSIAVAEYFINRGKYVAFLQEKNGQQRADLSIEGVHTEVKGMQSTKTNRVANNIKEAFEQIEADKKHYPPNTHRDGRVIIYSKYPNGKIAYKIVYGGYRKAKAKGYVKGTVELLHNGRLYKIGGK